MAIINPFNIGGSQTGGYGSNVNNKAHEGNNQSAHPKAKKPEPVFHPEELDMKPQEADLGSIHKSRMFKYKRVRV